jgi:acyl-CoA thioester hydrolase
MFTRTFTATPADIDELGHVNNAVWVRWIQDMATSHWVAVAPADAQVAFVWVVVRHEIDYRGNVKLGESVTGSTWIDAAPRGARFDRRVAFHDAGGKVVVEANTTWALIDRASGRVALVPKDLAGLFYAG